MVAVTYGSFPVVQVLGICGNGWLVCWLILVLHSSGVADICVE
jgi:hypothetical protein